MPLCMAQCLCDLTSKQGNYLSIATKTGDDAIYHILVSFNQIINLAKQYTG